MVRQLNLSVISRLAVSTSVIIPVYNDAARLGLCLDALRGQTLDREQFEVIVVDNGSTDSVGAVLGRFPEVAALFEPRPGSYRARNVAIEGARGDVIAFTDSDCLPAPDWLELGVSWVHQNPDRGFVAGSIKVFARDSRRPRAVELHQLLFDLRQEALLREEHFAATANMLTRRSVIDRAGPFNAVLKSGGDYEWGNRVTAMGMPGIFAPDVLVQHPARRSYRELGNKVRRLAGARFDGRTKIQGDKAWPGLKAFWPPLGTMNRILFDASLGPPAVRRRVLPVVLFVYLTGAAETLRLLAGGQSRR